MISLNKATGQSLLPEAADILNKILPEHVFALEHQLRHPSAIYSVSLQKLGDAFTDCATQYLLATAHRDAGKRNSDFPKLLQAQENLLRTLQEHTDDCLLVLQTLVSAKNINSENQFTESLLKASKLPGIKSFLQQLAEIKVSLTIANRLRHKQGRLRDVTVSVFGQNHLGYFLEEMQSDGSLGPSQMIHPDRGAFSFARDLRDRMHYVYRLSRILTKEIRTIQRELYGQVLIPTTDRTIPQWISALELIAKLPLAIFPKEQKKLVYIFELESDKLNIRGTKLTTLVFPARVNVASSFANDGYSLSFKVPFP